MSSENAFPLRSDCPYIPILPKITGTLVPACSSSDIILPPPDPIYEVPVFTFPLPKPPSADFGCYALQVQTREVTSGPHFVATVSYPNAGRTATCQPLIDFAINFNVACPSISGDKQPLQLGVPGFIEIHVLKLSPSSDESTACKFQLVPTARVPCPVFSPGSQDLVIGETDTGEVTIDVLPDDSGTAENGACTFTVDILVEVPKDPDASTTTTDSSAACCENITVVSEIDFQHKTGPRRYEMALKTLSFKLPKTEVLYQTIDVPLILSCNTAPSDRPFVPVSMESAGDGCCPSFTLHAKPLEIQYPSASTSLAGTVNASLCCTDIVAMDPTSFTFALNCSENRYEISYKNLSFKLPTVSFFSTDGSPVNLATVCHIRVPTLITTNTIPDCPCGTQLSVVYQDVSLGGAGGTASLICDVSLVSSSLVVKHQTLTFNCGLLTNMGTCA